MEELALPRDPQGFVRRQCPHCRRQFKTRPSSLDGASLQQALAQAVTHQNLDDQRASLKRWVCFYCGKSSAPEEYLTLEHRGWVNRVATALAERVRYEQLSHVTRTLAQNPRPTFVPMRPPPLPGVLPMEPDDMRRFLMLCCGDEVKAATGWQQRYHCPRCGTEHDGGRPIPKMPLRLVPE